MPRSGSSPAFIGRVDELAALRTALGRASDADPTIVVIAGEAGVGKTRLLDQFAAEASAAGAVVLIGGCFQVAERAVPYAPLIEALRSLMRDADQPEHVELVGPARHELFRLLPQLPEVVGHPILESPAEDPRSAPGLGLAQARLFELLLGVLERLGREKPVVLAVEDLHWADAATRDFLSFLARNLSSERLLVVVTYRTDELERGHQLLRFLGELERSARVERIDLAPFTPDELREQLAAILGSPPSPTLFAEIQRRSEGNPFFAEELLRASAHGDEQALPRTLVATVLGRLVDLTRTTREVLGICAAAGRRIEGRLLEIVADLPEPELLDALRQAVIRHLLVAEPGGDAYSFRHALIQEIVYRELLPGERRRLHARIAAVLTAHPELGSPGEAAALSEVAHHWVAADRRVEALRASIQAGLAAEAVYASRQAHRHYEQALELWEEVPEAARDVPFDKIDLLHHAAESANLAGEISRAVELVWSALALVDPEAEPLRAGALHGRLGYLLWSSGESEASLAAHREAVRLVPSEPVTSERARVLSGLCGALMGLGRYSESIPVCRDAISYARLAAAPAEEAKALNMLGCDLVGVGAVESGLAELEKARRIAEEVGPADSLIVAYHNLAYTLMQSDRLEDALSHALRGRDVAQRVGLDRRFGGNLRATAADALYRLGRWDQAEQLVREGLALMPAGESTIYLDLVGALVFGARGEQGQARVLIARAEQAAMGDVDFDLFASVMAGVAELAIWEKRLDDARTAVGKGLDRLEGTSDVHLRPPLVALGVRAEADRAELGWASRAREEVGAARRAADTFRDRLPGPRVGDGDGEQTAQPTRSGQAYRALANAEYSRLTGEHDAALWRDVALRWEEVAMPYPAAYARYRQAEAVLRGAAGRAVPERVRQEAAGILVAAGDASARAGAALLAREVAALARRARIELPEPVEAAEALEVEKSRAPVPVFDSTSAAPPRPDEVARRSLGLSRRELEVLALIAAGRTNSQIAEELFISPKTAGVHVTHILGKLGVSNRVEAAMVAARLGLAPEGTGESAAPLGVRARP